MRCRSLAAAFGSFSGGQSDRLSPLCERPSCGNLFVDQYFILIAAKFDHQAKPQSRRVTEARRRPKAPANGFTDPPKRRRRIRLARRPDNPAASCRTTAKKILAPPEQASNWRARASSSITVRIIPMPPKLLKIRLIPQARRAMGFVDKGVQLGQARPCRLTESFGEVSCSLKHSLKTPLKTHYILIKNLNF
jgi:hypothetical protein